MGIDVQPIEQIVLEPSLVDELTRSRLVAAIDPDVHVLRPFGRRAVRSRAPAGRAAAWPAGRRSSSPISSRKIEPRWASANLPLFVPVASVNAPLTWPKSSDSSSVSGMAAQLTLMNGMLALRAAMVHGASHQFLAGAGFAGDQHRAAGRRHQLDAPNHIGDGRAVADDAVPLKVRASCHRRERSVSCKRHKHSFVGFRHRSQTGLPAPGRRLHKRLNACVVSGSWEWRAQPASRLRASESRRRTRRRRCCESAARAGAV